MNNIKSEKGVYRVVKARVVSMDVVQMPSLNGNETYPTKHAAEIHTTDTASVSAINGEMPVIDINRGTIGVGSRLKAVIGLFFGNGVKIYGGAPTKDELMKDPRVQQYIQDSEAFRKVVREFQPTHEVISDKKFEVGSDGQREIPRLEEKV